MKAKVLTLLKPKAKSFGFTDDELMTVCETIANGLASKEDVTDDDINAQIDVVLPYLKLSQSASNRSYERMKKQFEEDQKKAEEDKKKAEEEAARKKAEEEEAKKRASEEPEWFKKYREDTQKTIKEQQDTIASMQKSKANEGFMAKAKAGLKDVDENYYALMLKNKEFGTEADVDSFVNEVTEGWNALVKARNIQALKQMVPPGGSHEEPTKPNDLVQQRIKERQEASSATNTVVKGLPTSVAK